jgi:IclR family acetate operon transcriptional repressor
MMSRPGLRLRAQNTAMGKILLSMLPDDQAAARFDPKATPTPNSVRSVKQFLVGMAETRERGYAVEDQENELGITCVAIGVPVAPGQPAVALSVSAPSVHMPEERCAEVVECLRDAARALHPLLGAGLEILWGTAPNA